MEIKMHFCKHKLFQIKLNICLTVSTTVNKHLFLTMYFHLLFQWTLFVIESDKQFIILLLCIETINCLHQTQPFLNSENWFGMTRCCHVEAGKVFEKYEMALVLLLESGAPLGVGSDSVKSNLKMKCQWIYVDYFFNATNQIN